MNLNQINVGGPCKLIDGGVSIYFEEGVTVRPVMTDRDVPSGLAKNDDKLPVDGMWEIEGTPKSVWHAAERGILLPDGFFNFSVGGGLMCGKANRLVRLVTTDADGIDFTRCCLTAPPSVYGGLGESVYDRAVWTAFIGQGKALTDEDAFWKSNAVAWDQSDYPVTHQEALCTGAWSGQAGFDTIYAEKGFKLQHELQKEPVKQGNITVDYKIQGYRGRVGLTPQQPSTAQLSSALAFQGAAKGIGVRRSAGAHDFVFAGNGLSVTLKSAAVDKGDFKYDIKANRHGEFGFVNALVVPGTRLVLA